MSGDISTDIWYIPPSAINRCDKKCASFKKWMEEGNFHPNWVSNFFPNFQMRMSSEECTVHFTYTIWLMWRMSFILQYFWGWIDDAVSDTVLTLQKIHVREGTTLACTICRWNNKCMWASIISNQRPFPQRRNLLLCLKFRLSLVYCQHYNHILI